MTTKKTATNGAKPTKKATTCTKAKLKQTKPLTANEAALIAWKDTYAKRDKRVA